ncbi:MAG: polysaccharide biosynthesis/export family protein, partial [Pseudomonadota bacterium]
MALAVAASAATAEVKLESGDQISLDVIRNPDLSRTLRVDEVGSVRVPYAGTLGVAGLTLDEAQDLVAKALEELIDLDRSSVFLDIVERNPVYVINNGTGSGPVPYRPGMTVMMAAASVSANRSGSVDLGLIEELEAARKPFELRQSVDQLASIRLRLARLGAELSGSFEPPDAEELGISESRRAALVSAETLALEARKSLMSTQDALLTEEENSISELISGLTKQIDVIAKRISLSEQERIRQETLVQQGLARQANLEAANAQVLDLEFAEIEVLTELGEAKSTLASIRRTKDALTGDRMSLVTESIADLETQTVQLEEQVRSLRRQVQLGGTTAIVEPEDDSS